MTERKPYSDATALLGSKLDGKDAKRDAVHLACEPVKNETSSDWYPGASMTFGKTGKLRPVQNGETPIGIIDPFLSSMNEDDDWVYISTGETCYLILLPGAITSLRHVWEHPSFDKKEEEKPSSLTDEDKQKKESENWLREFADSTGIDYEEMIDTAKDHVRNPSGWNYITGGNEAEGVYSGEEFWHHFGILFDLEIPEDQQGNIISCSC